MAIHEFGFNDVATVDGGAIKIAMDDALQQVIKDCVDRPLVSGSRSVTLELSIKTISSETEIEEVAIAFVVKHKVPAKSTRSIRMKPRANGKLVFNDDAPDSPLQHTIDEMENDADD